MIYDLDRAYRVLRPGITAIIAAHPARLRNGLLNRALQSVTAQTLQPAEIIVVNDIERHGAGRTRSMILDRVRTTQMAWLDSDDYWYPNHLQDLSDEATRTGAKYVFSWFDGAFDPLRHFGKTYDVHSPHHTTITALIDVALAKEVGYPDTSADGPFSNEDWAFISRFAELCAERYVDCMDPMPIPGSIGYPMIHLPKRTWYWCQDGQNTSGRPNQGDAQ